MQILFGNVSSFGLKIRERVPRDLRRESGQIITSSGNQRGSAGSRVTFIAFGDNFHRSGRVGTTREHAHEANAGVRTTCLLGKDKPRLWVSVNSNR